ncbi:nuclear transport factor 2 family protein [Massilia sp. NP310]|uniref:nuclear transport factor 2 family protein n=1 Tax=unclassified Massilia TaxID=2609279 RepID=UPI001E48B091|nr:nuclear transport factor 2 family protein [Massilia sp. NP310]
MRILPFLPCALLCLAVFQPAAGMAEDVTLSGAPKPASAVSMPGMTGAARDVEAMREAMRAAVRAAEQRRAQAVSSRDVATLRHLISRDYYHVETRGRARTRTEFLQLLTRDEYEFRSYEVDDTEIRMLDNGQAALVTGRFRAAAQGADGPRDLRGRYVRMWVLGPEGWRNTMQQTTEIRPLAAQRDLRTQR